MGHTAFTCATIREMEGMAAAGLGDDLLLANEVVDATPPRGARQDRGSGDRGDRLRRATMRAAVAAGVPEVLIDVNVGLPRCGCRARRRRPAGRPAPAGTGLTVRGVMGYEGHIVGLETAPPVLEMLEESMALLVRGARRRRWRDHLRRRYWHL